MPSPMQNKLVTTAGTMKLQGSTEQEILTYMRAAYPDLTADEIGRALAIATRGYNAAQSATRDITKPLGSLPGFIGEAGPFRVRTLIEGWAGESAFTASIDIILGPDDTLAAVYQYVDQYIADIIANRVTLPGHAGTEPERGTSPRVTILYIYPTQVAPRPATNVYGQP